MLKLMRSNVCEIVFRFRYSELRPLDLLYLAFARSGQASKQWRCDPLLYQGAYNSLDYTKNVLDYTKAAVVSGRQATAVKVLNSRRAGGTTFQQL